MTIGIPYTLNFTDPTVIGKTPFVINPNTTDGPLTPITNSPDSSATEIHTSIVLPGMGLVQYGERLEESILHILENFASCTPPVAPTAGQEWFDFCNKMMNVWDGVKWLPVSGTGLPIASTAEYNLMADDINKVLGTPIPGLPGTPTTVWGYNQQVLPILVIPPTESHWNLLIQTVRRVGQHQGTDVASLTDGGFTIPPYGATIGLAGMLQRYADLQAKIVAVRANRQNSAPISMESSTITGGSSTRTSPWGNDIYHTVRVNFTTNEHLFSYFNTGGTLNINALIDDNSTPANLRWQSQLGAFGTIKLSSFATTSTLGSTATGLYNLTGIPTTIFTNNVGGATGNTYSVKASVDTGTHSVVLEMHFMDRNPNGMYINETVTGNMTSSVSCTKASMLYLFQPGIAYPTMLTTLSLTEGGAPDTGSGPHDHIFDVTGNGSLPIPVGVTSVTLLGSGAPGGTISHPGSPEIPANPGQPYIAPTNWIPFVGTTTYGPNQIPVSDNMMLNTYPFDSTTMTYSSDLGLLSGYLNTIQNSDYPTITGNLNHVQLMHNSVGAGPGTTYSVLLLYTYPGGGEAGSFYNGTIAYVNNYNPGQPYIAPTPYQPATPPYTETTTGATTTANLNSVNYNFAGGTGGVATPSTQTATIPGTGFTLTYSVPAGGALRITYFS